MAGIRWAEKISLFTTIGELGVEDTAQKGMIFIPEDFTTMLETRPEDVAEHHAFVERSDISSPAATICLAASRTAK